MRIPFLLVAAALCAGCSIAPQPADLVLSGGSVWTGVAGMPIARAIAARGDDPNSSWSLLRSWASGKGPLAMKSAIIEFISAHGTSPEAALLMPRLMNDQTLSPLERKEALALSKHGPQMHGAQAESLKPKFSAPSGKSIALRPDDSFRPVFSLPSPSDHAAMRAMHLTIRENTRISLERPAPRGLETPRFDPSKSPDSVVMNAGMHKGEHLVHSLVEKLRSHARDERPVQVISGEPKVGKAKRKTAAKKRPSAKKAPKPKTRKKPAKKKARRK